MADDWRDTTLGDFLTLQRGFDLPQNDRVDGPYPVIASTGPVGTNREAMVKGPGVVIGRSGSLGGGQYIREDFWPLNTTLWVKEFNGNDPRFCYYLLKSIDFTKYNAGSGVPTLNRNHIHPLPVRVPTVIKEQQAIACILGALDDKIELNRRMNETLEGMARAVFKSWFVDFDPVRAKAAGQPPPGLAPRVAALFPDSFQDSELGEIPKGWRAGTLSELSGFVLGGDWGKDQTSGDNPVGAFCIRGADIPSLQSSGVGNMPVRFLKRSSIEKRSLTDGDLVIEISGGSPTQSTGRPVLITKELLDRLTLPLTCSNFCRLFRPSNKGYSKYLYLLLRLLYDADIFLQYENGTTGIKNFAFSNFSESHSLLIPPEPVATVFDEKMQPLFIRMQQLGNESSVLAELRDTLLPKLISGELRVPDAERIVGRVT
jgi:type I restriction enzyme S subunit